MRRFMMLALPVLFLSSCGGGESASAEPETRAKVTPAQEGVNEEGGPETHHARPPLPGPEELKKLPPDGGSLYNRLVFEKSPYLLQHAANPVDWYPWGDEAFARASREDKPVFLSIGYSTCHWCHVMERESFEDEEVARLLNERFVCIKVDREEREDVDGVYMEVCIALTGSGGWPLSVFLTPDRRPILAGTYYPKEDRFGQPGFMSLCRVVSDAWRSERDSLLDNAKRLTEFLRRDLAAEGKDPGQEILDQAFAGFRERYDPVHGGFGQQPKFPSPHDYTFLLRYWKRTGKGEALEMVHKSLLAMRRGGIYDHVGFGFHRYATDRRWLLPHFEKMLYDQATLLIAYTEGWLATGDEELSSTVREIVTYVLRDMTSREGGFTSAEDADSEGEEGKFYLWKKSELLSLLGADDGALFASIFGVGEDGNFREEASGEKTGTSILHLRRSLAEEAAERGLDPALLAARWESARARLFAARKERIHPLKDDKILAGWNGLMIAALSRASRALDEPEWARAAARAADFVLSALRDRDGRLLRRYRQGEAAHKAYLDDYAFLVFGLIELYQTTFETRWLDRAQSLTTEMVALFGDEEGGGFFFSGVDGEELLVRRREIYDGAVPSGNSIATLDLLFLARLLDRSDLEERAIAMLRSFTPELEKNPQAYSQLLSALDFVLGPSQEIVVAGDPGQDDTRALLRALRTLYVPNEVTLLRPFGSGEDLSSLPEYVKDKSLVGGKAAAYVCESFSCQAPVTEAVALIKLLTTKPKAPSPSEAAEGDRNR